jgi:YD repeat-containing protein
MPAKDTYAHVTSETNALGYVAKWQWDYEAGKVTTATDINNVNTTYSYSDRLDRMTQKVAAAGLSGFQGQTNVTYTSPTDVQIQQDQTSWTDQALHTEMLYDGFGREIEERHYKKSNGTYISTTKSYDALGRVAATTDPSIPGDGLNYATTYGYDALGRTVSVSTADGAVARTSYTSYYTTAADQAGHARVTQTDALGRLGAVWEDPGGFNYETTYAYDVLDDLTGVYQGSETRTFSYDSMKRLLSAANPESGTTSYTYDSVGNLLTKTDVRGIKITYAYDALNRITGKGYSDGTSPVGYQYDAAGAGYSWGHLTSVWNAIRRRISPRLTRWAG